MKKLIYVFFALTLGLAVASCGKEYDDTALQNKVDGLSKQVTELAQKVADLNLQVVGMKEVLDQWKAGGYIQNIDNSVPGQHTITFLGGKTVVILDGAQGATGPAPDVYLKQENGEYYWYVGDTKLGPAAYTPVFSVNDNGELIVTVNGVQTNLGVLKGQSWFKDIKTLEDKVVFTLLDDTSFEIPFAKAFKLVIGNTQREVADGEVVDFPYSIQNANATTTVDAFAGGNYQVKVEAEKIVVTVPTPATAGQVLVWAQNNEGLFSMVKLTFTPGASVTVVSSTEDLTAIPAAGGEVVVNLVSNIDVEMEAPSVDWVSPVLTKSNYTLTLTVKGNTTGSPRETELHILRSDTKAVVQTIKLVQIAKDEPVLTIKRVWGKYSTGTGAWNSYLEGFNANADRNVTMDDKYIYIAEAKPSVKKIWALNKADGSFAKNLPTETVKDAGTFPLCCPRVINLGGAPVLMVCNMTESAAQENFWLYVYENGIDAEPTAVQLSGAADRMGDTFSFWGASATNSVDGLGLTKGLLYFDTTNNNGVRIWKTLWTKGNLPAQAWVQNRYGFDNGSKAVGAFWTYPGNKDAGIWAGRGSAEDPTKSVFGGVKTGAPNLWTSEGDQLANTECNVIESGYYNNVTAYQFFSFNGKRYIAYAKQVNGSDGRLIILEGEATDEWSSLITNRKVVYQAAIQEAGEMKDAYNESPLASGHSGMDLCIRPSADAVDIVVLKQNVGLSLFRMKME